MGWLVAPPPRSALPGTSRERGGTRGVTVRDRAAMGTGGQADTPSTLHPSCCKEGAPASTSFHFLSEPELLYEVPVPSGTPAPARVPLRGLSFLSKIKHPCEACVGPCKGFLQVTVTNGSPSSINSERHRQTCRGWEPLLKTKNQNNKKNTP